MPNLRDKLTPEACLEHPLLARHAGETGNKTNKTPALLEPIVWKDVKTDVNQIVTPMNAYL